ncbi:MAG: hypothetical protein IT210_03855 [Armatimonadetes bacterium]|nr:hypothetical protein [Armatimonadota bacterium]
MKPSFRRWIALIVFAALMIPGATLADSADYLPLSVGEKWILKSPALQEPISFEVTAQKENGFRVKLDNPWAKAEMVLEPRGSQCYLNEITINGQTAIVPGGLLFFDFAAPEGTSWTNGIGTLTVTSRKVVVYGARQTYEKCIEIRQTGKDAPNAWTFAPGVGFVRFGEGSAAFVLERVEAAGAKAGPQVRIGLSPNPSASEGYTLETVKARLKQSVDAGASYFYISPKWNEIEREPGKYSLDEIDFQSGLASSRSLPQVCNLRVVDTNQRAVPSDLKSCSFSDPKMRERLLALIEAVMPCLKDAQLVLIGNEIDGYFQSRPDEMAAYKELFRAAADKVKSLKPGVKVSASLTFGNLALADTLLKPLLDISDFLAVTYYPLKPDFTYREPDAAEPDIDRMVAAAKGKPLLLQEVGYSTSALNGSSEDMQARFFENVFKSMRDHAKDIWGANVFLMCDLPDSLVNTLGDYYSLPDAGKFKSFLKTLGLFDGQGKPKKSWEVFRQQAPLMAGSASEEKKARP